MSSIAIAEIYSDLSEFPVERRFDTSIEVSKLKEKLEPVTGANHKTMTVSLTVKNNLVGILDDQSKTLADYIGQRDMGEKVHVKMHVKDDQSKDLLTGDVPKYTISEDKYAQRPDNVRNFIKELRQKNDTSKIEE